MRRYSIILLFWCVMGYFMPALAQDPQVDLPWMPQRDTNGIRTIRAYSVDTLTGSRKLMRTTHYDRHGFMARPTDRDRLTYDTQGRLTEYTSFNDDGTLAMMCNITYASDGIVQRIEIVDDYYPTITYELLTHKTHPKYGLLDYTFRCKTTNTYDGNDYFDTVFIRREYDTQGHLLHEEQGGSQGEWSRNISYRYDASGRRIARSGIYYEWADTVDYLYNDQGVLTGMKGGWYGFGEEGEFVVRCHPDGTPIEKREYYREFEWDLETGEVKQTDKPAVLLSIERYDDKGVLIYEKNYLEMSVTEYEIEYW